MKIDGNRLTFAKTLEAKYSGKLVEETDTEITIEGEDEDSYFKLYSPFRGVEKLLLFENGRWADANSGGGSAPFDFSSLNLGDMGAGLGDLGGDLGQMPPTESDDDQPFPTQANEEVVDAEIVQPAETKDSESK